MADVDHRKSLQILHKRTGRDKVIIIRDKFRMHTRFFTACHDFFQFSILLDAQGDRDLIQRIERQNRIQIVNFADHAHSLIFFAPLLMVIQNTADFIAPLRVDIHTVNKSFRCPAVTDQKQMLLVISLRPHRPERYPQDIPHQNLSKEIDAKKQKYHRTGEVVEILIFTAQVKHQ